MGFPYNSHTMSDTASFGYWVRRRRKALDLTQETLARRVGCATITLQKIEADERRPSRQLAELLADGLAIPAAERADFLRAARGERSVAHIPVTTQPIAAPPTPSRFNNLPPQPNAFVGRERALSELAQLLARTRLLTLTGPGGIGKTRLALQLAERVQQTYADGVCLVSLAPARDARHVAQLIAETLAVKTLAEAGYTTVLQKHFSDKALLLVLDNFEHLLPAASWVSALLTAAPRLRVLVTSREPLGIYGEQAYVTPPLTLPQLSRPEFWPILPQVEAVSLFLQRARAVNPDFHLTAENAMAVAEICVRLDGLPLALELAAARSRVFTPPALLQRLNAALPILTGGARDLPARQQTLRHTIDWSYDLLTVEEQQLFSQLAVFTHGFTLDAVEFVCGAEAIAGAAVSSVTPILDLLAALVNKSLVQQTDNADGEMRFVMLETIREYAQEKLASSRAEATIRRRHLLYYTQLAEASESHIFGATQPSWLQRLLQEHDNVRAALHWSLTSEDEVDAALGLRLVGVLSWFWHFHGYWNEGRQWVTQLLERNQSARGKFRAKALCGLGLLAWAQDDYATAKTALQTGSALSPLAPPSLTRAHTLGLLGLVLMYELQFAAAEPLVTESLAVFRALHDSFGVAISLVRLGIIARMMGDLERALELNTESLTLYRELNNAWGIGISLASLAETALAQHAWRNAAHFYRDALATMRLTGSQWYVALVMVGIANVAIARGQLQAAAQLLGVGDAMLAAVHGRIPPIERLPYEQALATIRSQLGEATFAAAYAEGQSLTASEQEQVVAAVLREL
jgi:predicted ATPase/DNA-binding XRE family transcriptional regulator